jgi:hypothetical protein
MPGGNNLNSVLFAAVIPSEAGGEVEESFDVRVKPEIRRLGSMTDCEIG